MLLHLLEDLAQEVLEAESDKSVPVFVVLLKDVRHPLQRNTRLDKQIKTHDAFAAFVVRAKEQVNKLRTESVPKRNQRICKLAQRNVAAAIHVKPVKECAPRRKKRPQPTEFVKPNRSTAV